MYSIWGEDFIILCAMHLRLADSLDKNDDWKYIPSSITRTKSPQGFLLSYNVQPTNTQHNESEQCQYRDCAGSDTVFTKEPRLFEER